VAPRSRWLASLATFTLALFLPGAAAAASLDGTIDVAHVSHVG
jgi:hypothetical protein